MWHYMLQYVHAPWHITHIRLVTLLVASLLDVKHMLTCTHAHHPCTLLLIRPYSQNWYGHPIPMYPSDTSNCQHAAHALRAIIASEQSRSTTTYSQAFPTGIIPATIQGQVTICRWSGMTPSETRAPTRLAPWCPLRQPFGRNDPHTNNLAKHLGSWGTLSGSAGAHTRHLNRLQQACA